MSINNVIAQGRSNNGAKLVMFKTLPKKAFTNEYVGNSDETTPSNGDKKLSDLIIDKNSYFCQSVISKQLKSRLLNTLGLKQGASFSGG